MPWWTTDVGGFFGGFAADEGFRELLVRWFEFGVFCPIFRLHGVRAPFADDTGAPNEVWSFGEPVYRMLASILRLRERLLPYVREQVAVAARTGLPPMRPLFVDFPTDDEAWGIEDEFLLGPDLLVAPVVEPGLRSREVYLPRGAEWTDPWTGERHPGGRAVTAEAPLGRPTVFIRDGRRLPIAG